MFPSVQRGRFGLFRALRSQSDSVHGYSHGDGLGAPAISHHYTAVEGDLPSHKGESGAALLLSGQ